jgi:enoyl-CoA hydratase/carnithine racemase
VETERETGVEFETVIYERRDRTACITLNRPDKLNAIDHTMIRELDQAYRAAEADDDVWTLIVTGAGTRALCSGADVGTVAQPHPGMDTRGEALLGSFWQWNASAEATPPYLEMAKPIICAVNGLAAGAGLDLVTTSDIAIASTTATFLDPHVSIGLVSAREAVRLARVLPLNVAMRLSLMGTQERLSAQRAYELGLVTELVEPDALMDRAWEIAEMVNRNAPLAVRGTRLGIRMGLTLPVPQAELLAEGHRLRVAQTDDAEEGPQAFLEKRPPEWKAR